MEIRKAVLDDLDGIEAVYNSVHEAEERGLLTIGWKRGIYPVRQTAEDALKRNDMFVLTEGGRICAAAVINKIQVDIYSMIEWEHDVPDDEVCVLHTLAVDPQCAGKGYGSAFVRFYEEYAASEGCTELRIDTNEKNTAARAI